MTTMLDRVKVEILEYPVTGGFRLDASRLGTGPALALIARSWREITAEVKIVNITRGSRREGLQISPSVGTASITFVNPPERLIRPATPLRITADGERLFTGSVLDTVETIGRSDLRKPIVYSTLTAVDLVQTVANTMRYGAYQTAASETPWKGFETAEERFRRLLEPTGFDWNIGPESRHLGWYEIGGLRIGHVRPPVQQVRPISGVGSPTAVGYFGGEFRSPGPYEGAGDPAGSIYTGLTLSGPSWVTIQGWINPFSGEWPPIVPDAATRPPQSFRIVIMSAANEILAESAPFRTPADDWTRFSQSLFVAATGVVWIHIAVGETWGHPGSQITSPGYRLSGVSVTNDEYGAGLEVQNVVYESTLANHLDLVAATSNGSWWVDRFNVLQVRTSTPPPSVGAALHLTDGTKPGVHSYVDLSISADTAGTINTIQFENHGRVRDPESNRWIAHDVTISGGQDATAVATYGPRAGQLPTALPITPPSLPIFSSLPKILGREYLNRFAIPKRAPRSVRLWRDPDSPSFPPLDLGDPVDVTHRGDTHLSVITGITHSIDRRNWHTDLELVERK